MELIELPYEMLESIFDYVLCNDLKNLMLIESRFREIVITSPRLMRKLRLVLWENWRSRVPFIEENGNNVKELIFDHTSFEKPNEFKDLMKLMRGIEILKLNNVHIIAENITKKYKVLSLKIPKIKKLDMDNSKAVPKVLKLYLKKLQVQELKLDFSHYNTTSDLTEFLCKQKHLKKLTLSGFENIMYKSLFSDDINDRVQFQLKHLIINHRIVPNASFLSFLKTQKSLEKLEVHKEINITEFFNVIFEMSIASLTLQTNFVTLKNINFKKISNSNISELVLFTKKQYGIEQTINFLVSKLQNLKTLKIINSITDSSDQLLGYVHLKKLENLHIENSKLKFIQNINFNCLKSIHLCKIYPFLKFEDWTNLLKNNTGIEEITLSEIECYYVTESIKTEIDNIIYNLHYLKFVKIFELYQELRYQKPIKVVMRTTGNVKKMQVSDSFIKICRDEFHLLRKINSTLVQDLSYFADENLYLNNKYLKQ